MLDEIAENAYILVVDPDLSARNRLAEMFQSVCPSQQKEGKRLAYVLHGCDTCASAIANIRKLQNDGLNYQLLILEYALPDGNGLQLVPQLWQLDADLHVVLCTADSKLSWREVADTLGESDQLLILKKPASELELRQIVHTMVRKRQLGMQSKNVMHYMQEQIRLRTGEIETANKTLLQAEKLAAVGRLAAGIAHEINTPAQYVSDNLNAINDFFGSLCRVLDIYRQTLNEIGQQSVLDQLYEQEKLEDIDYILEDAPQAIRQAMEGVEQIVRIVQATKGFSHAGQSRIANLNVNQVLENTLLIAKSSYKYVADIETAFADVPVIECFSGELSQVFLNVIVNAAQAIEGSHKDRGRIVVATAPVEEGVEIRISDTGNGIPEAIRERIFDPFFTTKDVGKGSGQGLNIAYRIIHEQHKGKIGFISKIGVGTTFIIQLKEKLSD